MNLLKIAIYFVAGPRDFLRRITDTSAEIVSPRLIAHRFSRGSRRQRRIRRQRGFTLMLATLIASLLLVLGAAMFGITRKEIILSSIGRDSQFAFYAADSGAECALYWDIRHDIFATTTPYAGATCDAQSLGTIQFPGYGVAQTFEYQPNGYCSRVSVTKKATAPTTIIYSRGYSTACASIATNPRALERAVELTY